jgi:hypothetical protein
MKQQDGYGEAESLLRFKHLIFFGPTGTAKWRGQIYGTTRFSWFVNRPIIYHGIFGEGFFQSIYPAPQSESRIPQQHRMVCADDLSFWPGIFLPGLRIVPYLMLGGTFCVALSYMVRARIEPKFDTSRAPAGYDPRVCATARARILPVFHLAAFQTHTGKRHSEARTFARTLRSRGSLSRRVFWSEQGRDRHYFLGEMFRLLEKKAGAIPPTAAGTTGTFKFTAISGGASRFKPSPNITAQESV